MIILTFLLYLMSPKPIFFTSPPTPSMHFVEAQALLYSGIKGKSLEKVSLAIDNGASPNINILNSNPPLAEALQQGDVSILNFLWERGARFPVDFYSSKSQLNGSLSSKDVFVWMYEKDYFSDFKKAPLEILKELSQSHREATPFILKWLIEERKLGDFGDYLVENQVSPPKLNFYFSDIFSFVCRDKSGECLKIFIDKLDKDIPEWRISERLDRLIREKWIDGLVRNEASLLNTLNAVNLFPTPHSKIERNTIFRPIIFEVLSKAGKDFSPNHSQCLKWFLDQDEWKDELFKNEDWSDVILRDDDIVYQMADFLLEQGFDVFTLNSKGENFLLRRESDRISSPIKAWVFSKNRPDALLVKSKANKVINMNLEERESIEKYMLSQLPKAQGNRVKNKL